MGSKLVDIDGQIITCARTRGSDLLRTLENLPRLSLDMACERAARAVEQYSIHLTDELVASLSTSSPSEVAKVKSCYSELALEFAQSVRDLEPDSERRHAIAQAIQFKILESERRLRSLLEALAPSAAHQR